MRTTWSLLCLAFTLAPLVLAPPSAAAPAPVRVTVALALPDAPALERFLADVQDPASPAFHQFLTNDAFVAQYAPSAADVAEAAAWLAAQGMTVTNVSADRLLLHGLAPVDVASTLVAGPHVLAVLRSDTSPTLRPMHDAFQAATMGSTDAYSPNDTARAYDEQALYDANVTGKGWSVAIATAYDVKSADVRAFDSKWGLSYHTLSRTCVDGSCHFSSSGGSDETTLDVEWSQATARGSSIKIVEGTDASLATFTDVYDQVASNSTARSVSTSWGICESEMSAGARAADEQIFMSAAAKGQSWFAASGDSGSADCNGKTGVDYPASSPHVVAVGGTRLDCAGWPRCTGHGNETAWSGSGGGASAYYAAPSWQANATGATKRLVPDVALAADPERGSFVRFNGAWYVFGGTSEAAPQWAGLFALVDQQKHAAQGLPSARLYALANTTAFHDITSGSNGMFTAGPGDDEVTGLGSFDAAALVRNY